MLNNGLWLGASFISLIPGSVVSDRLGSWNHHNPSSPHYSSAHFVHQLFSPFSPTTESGSRVLSHWPINSYSGLRLAVANFIVWSETRYNPKTYFEGSKHCFQPTLLNYQKKTVLTPLRFPYHNKKIPLKKILANHTLSFPYHFLNHDLILHE